MSFCESSARYSDQQAQTIVLGGRVQGVGFRPFVYRLAHQYHITGTVRNELGRVSIVAQGSADELEQFRRALIQRAPPLSKPVLERVRESQLAARRDFSILPSDGDGKAQVHLPPDFFMCADCQHELFDPANRRYRYPFINCTQCGPRYTLIKRLPYDRPNTTMAEFTLCAQCRQEYQDPLDRRFHAEPIACPVCGPQLQYYSDENGLINDTAQALVQCVDDLRDARIVALKGIGGYHLVCDAHSDTAIRRLRNHKPRPDKPLAVMFPLQGADGLDAIRPFAQLDDAAARQLSDPMRPIVLLRKRKPVALSKSIAPGLNEIGVLLPYSPLHALLLHDFAGPLVVTSANISGEPVMTSNPQVERRLHKVSNSFLHHNRPIERPADDAVFRVIAKKARPLRLGRGIAPLELFLASPIDTPTLAVGGHMKNTVALAWDQRVVISPHVGELDSPRSLEVFEQLCLDLQRLYRVRAERLVCDAHPGYASSRWARRDGRPLTEVYHHRAHASALAGEYAWQKNNWLVFTWDGTGYGEDGTLWGGETFYGRAGQWRRLASLRPFALPGGDKAGREPWRAAQALCWQADVHWPGQPQGTELLYKAWQQGLNCPSSSAVGRLFDGAAALLGVCAKASFEGQGPMQLEALASAIGVVDPIALPLEQDGRGVWRCDWSPLLPMLLDAGLSAAERARCFHQSLARHVLEQSFLVREQCGDFTVGLTGGVFQNRLLSEQVISLLHQEGFQVYLPQSIPCNDGGLCFGQLIESIGQTRD